MFFAIDFAKLVMHYCVTRVRIDGEKHYYNGVIEYSGLNVYAGMPHRNIQ